MSSIHLVVSDSTYDYFVGEMVDKAMEMERLELVFDVEVLPKPSEEYTWQEVRDAIGRLSPEQLISLAADLMH